MKNNNPEFEYSFDFSKEISYEIDEDNELDELLREALKDEQKNPQPRIIDPQKKENLIKVRACLYQVAKENGAKITVKHGNNRSRICIEVENDVIDFDTDLLKRCFYYVLKFSKFVSIETRTNEKSAIIAEVDVFKNDEE